MRGVDRRQRSRGWFKKSVVGVALAMLLPFGVSVAGAGTASAAFNPDGFDFWVDSSMGPIKSRVFRAADGNTNRVVYALDGMRAREDLNGWEIDTEVARSLTAANINVVMPVGGQSSFYADWNAPSTIFGLPAGSSSGSSGSASGSSSGSGALQLAAGGPGKSYTYKWETFITQNLRNALRDRLGFSPYRNGVFGLSMGGSGALTLAAYHPDQFSFAGSYSGYLNISAPGMREAIRIAMVDAGGYNVDAMAPPWGPQWLRMDPFVFAPRLVGNNTRLWISAASGLPNGDPVAFSTLNGMGLEALALANTRAFQVRMATLGANNVHYDFPAFGIHNWRNWEDQVNRMIPDLSANIG
ncbi:alpha/beta hydrolase [Nocardia otitidiscaviarum]|uniref:Esterase family protein n=1 Tax=Nocardia otitidiscaviarum TaxID=1823 RepID=A0A516NU79_9NOCA|nr:alpha/beta hydrolase family protein [Nocardia otitidiscaviarum]MBF6178866.1 esterase family protein [Nocardia otitidiscaviarum]MCP9621847.1 esterase family protein [Nocardia otitidiscaviarum]QDP82470.1 esterase family protein [Nocardia otitidiscaviarum]